MHSSRLSSLLAAALLLAATACNNLYDLDSLEPPIPEESNNTTGENNSNNVGSNNTSSCTDRDGDGVPSGDLCAADLSVDCDDSNAAISPFEPELCNGLDDDCSGSADDGVSAPQCPLRVGVCLGARRPCQGDAGFGACDAATYGQLWVEEEQSPDNCDDFDNDCDGETDEGCSCDEGDERPCGSDVGVCEQGTQRCEARTWGACVGATGPTDEVCDGLDNDCDSEVDNDLGLPPLCALQQGVCMGRRAVCQGAGGWSTCGADEYGEDWVASEGAGQCDSLDNDCDGTVDEGCVCVDGDSRACGSETGACEEGMQTCAGGTWGACEGGITSSTEICDGVDNNCNGVADESGASCMPRNNTLASCQSTACVYACATGFVDLNSDLDDPTGDGCECEIRPEICDNQDNDCDGQTDEGAGSNALTRSCYNGPAGTAGVGICTPGEQTCQNGTFTGCMGETRPDVEVCDNLDNNCDGMVDEGFWQVTCGAGDDQEELCFSNATLGGLLELNTCTNGSSTCLRDQPNVDAEEQVICPGTFTQGEIADATRGDTGASPEHTVTLTRAYLASSIELLRSLFVSAHSTLASPYRFSDPGTSVLTGSPACHGDVRVCPQRSLNWYEAVAIANVLTAQFNVMNSTDLSSCYRLTACSDDPNTPLICAEVSYQFDCTGFRLPTEAEWEYMTRAGKETTWYNDTITAGGIINDANLCMSATGLDDIAVYCANSLANAWSVRGDRARNPWNLSDVSGNVEEWVWDIHATYAEVPQTDPLGPIPSADFKARVVRGGHYMSDALGTRSAARSRAMPGDRSPQRGVRYVRTIFPVSN